jgi:tetratricopeptide (TPR) repeat protein
MRATNQAANHYQAAEQQLNLLLSELPDDPTLRLELALNVHRSANLLRREHGPAVVISKYEIACDMLKALNAQDPGNDEVRRRLSDLAGDAARAHVAAGNQEKAIAAFQLCLASWWTDHERGTLDLKSRTILATICRRLAELLEKNDQQHDAVAAYQQAIAVLETAAPAHPENSPLRKSQVDCYRRMAVIQDRLGDNAAAERSLQRAKSIEGMHLSSSEAPSEQ